MNHDITLTAHLATSKAVAMTTFKLYLGL